MSCQENKKITMKESKRNKSNELERSTERPHVDAPLQWPLRHLPRGVANLNEASKCTTMTSQRIPHVVSSNCKLFRRWTHDVVSSCLSVFLNSGGWSRLRRFCQWPTLTCITSPRKEPRNASNLWKVSYPCSCCGRLETISRKKVEKGDKFTALKRFWSRWDERGLIFYTTVW